MAASTNPQIPTHQATEPHASQAAQPSGPIAVRGGIVKVRAPKSGKEKLDEVVRAGMLEEGDELRYSMKYRNAGKIDASIIVTSITPSCRLDVAITSTATESVSRPASEVAPSQAVTQLPPVTLQRLHFEIQGPSALQSTIFEAHGIPAKLPKGFPVWKRFQVHRNGQDIGSLWDLRETLAELRATGDKATFEKITANRRQRGPPKLTTNSQRVARGLELISQGTIGMEEERDEAVIIATELYKFLTEVTDNLNQDVGFSGYYDQRLRQIASRSKTGVWAEITEAVEGGDKGGDSGGDIEEREEE